MNDISVGKIERGRIWLPVSYNGTETKFAYPPVRGTHKEVFEAINKDTELRPAEGIELPLLVHAAYNSQEPEWQDIRQTAIVSNYTRVPTRSLWIPNGYVTVDGKVEDGLRGVLVERDIKGLGLSTRISVPDLKDWKQNEHGIYVSPDKNSQFVPESKYSDNFEKDGFTIATFTPEGTEIFAETARKANKSPQTWKVDISKITAPEQRVSLLCEGSVGLVLGGDYWYGSRVGLGFGVFDSREASPQKI